MSAQDNIAGVDKYVLQATLGAYSDEAYTEARKLSGTGITSPNPNIDTDTETFVGQMRWYQPLNANINVASLTDSTDGTPTDISSDYLRYIKTVRTHGATKVNMQQVVSREDALKKIGRDFGETKAQDEHNSILSVCKGVAVAELLNGAAVGSGATGLGGQTFENDPTDKKYGFYVDLGAAGVVSTASVGNIGAQRASGFLNAFGMAFKDYEPEYAYLISSPETMASFRSANLVDNDRVTDGEVEFDTIFQGKFRLIQTRANQSFTSAELTKLNTGAGVDLVGTKTSFIVLPGALAKEPLQVPMPVEIERRAASYKGGGTTSIWYRWGNVYHPAGYNWNGNDEDFPSDAGYMYVNEDGTPTALAAATDVLASTTGTWSRKAKSALSLGILPILHA